MLRPEVRKKLDIQSAYYARLTKDLRMPDSVILDIGANEGFISATFLGRGHRVVAIEPDPRNIKILKARFQGNRHFSLYPCLCGAASGSRPFWISQSNSAFSTGNLKWKRLLSEGKYPLHSHFAKDPMHIQVTTMDEIIRIHGKIAFAKIDTEGSELDCLQGLSEKIPLLVFEANLPEFAEESISCVLRLAAIDGGALFSYSSNFKTEGAGYLAAGEFCRLIESMQDRNIDIICRMSNYKEYYGMQAELF